MKASHASEVQEFTDIPNVGPRIAADFIIIGLKKPQDLLGKDPFTLYQSLCNKTKTRHDPCVLDTFLAAVDFMNGAKTRPWWNYTSKRKKQYPEL